MSAIRSPLPAGKAAILMALAALALSPLQVAGQQPAAKQPKRIVVPEFRQTPWRKVFAWLAEETGLPVVCSFMPTRSFTFVPPNPLKKYTLSEVMDILHQSLLSRNHKQQYYLLHRQRNFVLVPADDIDETLIPRLTIGELEERGRTELVSVVLYPRNCPSSDLAPAVRRLLGPVGEVVPLGAVNALVLWGPAGKIRHICPLLRELDQGELANSR
jgi:hypothetical protein